MCNVGIEARFIQTRLFVWARMTVPAVSLLECLMSIHFDLVISGIFALSIRPRVAFILVRNHASCHVRVPELLVVL